MDRSDRHLVRVAPPLFPATSGDHCAGGRRLAGGAVGGDLVGKLKIYPGEIDKHLLTNAAAD